MMLTKSELLARFTGQENDGNPIYLPDLSLWYEWHSKQSTLPEKWSDHTLPQIARKMGVPVWMPVRPWRVEVNAGVEITHHREAEENIIRIETGQGELVARWTLGPDGDWWQTEYPVKSSDDLAAALEWIRAREYILDAGEVNQAAIEVDDAGLLALEIPWRPYSELLHDVLGWSDGLVLLGEPEIQEMLELLEMKFSAIVEEIARLSGDVFVSMDNLDGQFISPRVFTRHFVEGYRTMAKLLDKPLVVHVGGPVSRLLEPLSSVGVAGVEGVCGAPQGDTTLSQARELTGPDFALWGGIPQDILTDIHSEQVFEESVQQIVRDIQNDPRMILGVADRVPTTAELNRLEVLPSLISHARE